MRVPDASGRPSVRFNMTPMIDVVFLLIIFFLLAGHMAKQETDVELSLPEARSGIRTEDDTARRVVVNITAEGEWLVGGRTIDRQGLARMLAFETETSEQPLEIRIRTDKRTPYRFVGPVLVECSKAGVWNVQFSVIEKR
ncbi:biopolymer transporter ExbD [Thermostilla marina]